MTMVPNGSVSVCGRSLTTDDIPFILENAKISEALQQFQLWLAYQSACFRHRESATTDTCTPERVRSQLLTSRIPIKPDKNPWTVSSFLSCTGSIKNTFIELKEADPIFERNPLKLLAKKAVATPDGLFTIRDEPIVPYICERKAMLSGELHSSQNSTSFGTNSADTPERWPEYLYPEQSSTSHKQNALNDPYLRSPSGSLWRPSYQIYHFFHEQQRREVIFADHDATTRSTQSAREVSQALVYKGEDALSTRSVDRVNKASMMSFDSRTCDLESAKCLDFPKNSEPVTLRGATTISIGESHNVAADGHSFQAQNSASRSVIEWNCHDSQKSEERPKRYHSRYVDFRGSSNRGLWRKRGNSSRRTLNDWYTPEYSRCVGADDFKWHNRKWDRRHNKDSEQQKIKIIDANIIEIQHLNSMLRGNQGQQGILSLKTNAENSSPLKKIDTTQMINLGKTSPPTKTKNILKEPQSFPCLQAAAKDTNYGRKSSQRNIGPGGRRGKKFPWMNDRISNIGTTTLTSQDCSSVGDYSRMGSASTKASKKGQRKPFFGNYYSSRERQPEERSE